MKKVLALITTIILLISGGINSYAIRNEHLIVNYIEEYDHYESQNLYNLGLTFINQKLYNSALNAFQDALTKNDNWLVEHKHMVLLKLALTYIHTSNYRSAILTCDDLIRYNHPDVLNSKSMLLYIIGDCYLQINDLEKAIQSYREVLEQDDEWIQREDNKKNTINQISMLTLMIWKNNLSDENNISLSDAD